MGVQPLTPIRFENASVHQPLSIKPPPFAFCRLACRGGTCNTPFGRPTFTVRRHSLFCHPDPVTSYSRKNNGCRCGKAFRIGNRSDPATTLSYLSSRPEGRDLQCAIRTTHIYRSPLISFCHPEPVTSYSRKNNGCRCGKAFRLGNRSHPATTLSYLSSRAGGRGTCSAPFGRPTFTVRRHSLFCHPEPVTSYSRKNNGCRCGKAFRLGNRSHPATTLSYLSSRP